MSERDPLDIARDLVGWGVPVFRAVPHTDGPDGCGYAPCRGRHAAGFHPPGGWQNTPLSTSLAAIDAWRPGDALCAVGGYGADFGDTDPRNGGVASRAAMVAAGIWPRVYGVATTPNGGTHEVFAPVGAGKGTLKSAPGVDFQFGTAAGSDHGFVFIAPTVRLNTAGEAVAYRWIEPPDLSDIEGDDSGAALAEALRAERAPRPVEVTRVAADLFETPHDPHSGVIPMGERHARMLAYAGRLVEMGLRYEEAKALYSRRWADCEQEGYLWTLAEALDNPFEDAWRRYLHPRSAPTADAGTTGEQEGAAQDEERFVPLDWAAEFATDYTNVDWLPGRLCQRGEQIACVGDGKVGKSLFWLDWARHAVTGADYLGTEGLKPLTVVYADRENSRRDIVQRLLAYGATPDELDRLVYFSFPPFRFLDVTGDDLMYVVEKYDADVVILDTVSRFVQGKESEADTWLSLYRMMHARLKGQKRAGVRLDHFGKDADRGARGSSAKSQDIDHVWEMFADSTARTGSEVRTRLELVRTHTRSGVGPDKLELDRSGTKDELDELWVPGSTRHVLAASGDVWRGEGVKDISAMLDEAGVTDKTLGRERLSAAGRKLGIKVSTDMWGLVVKYRRAENSSSSIDFEIP